MPFLIFLLIPILLGAFFTWDQVIKLEHQEFHDQWVEDGEPTGMFWRPSESRPSFRSGMATQKLMFTWLFRNPEWAESSQEGLKLLRSYRILVLAWNISFPLFVCVIVGLFGS